MGCTQAKPKASQSLDGLTDLFKNSNNTLNLPENRKNIIRKTWSYLEADVDNLGVRKFLRIFDQNPTVKRLFPFKDKCGDALIKDTSFQGHAHR